MEPFGEHSENEAHFSDSERNEMNDLLLEEIPTTSTGVPFDFDKLSGSEIYDTFVGKEGKKHGAGFCARYVFTQLVRDKKTHPHIFETIPAVDNWHEELGSKLEKTKKGQEGQRKLFVTLCTEYGEQILQRVRFHCTQHYLEKISKQKKIDNAHQGVVSLRGVDTNLCARVMHLAVEEQSKDLLVQIFECRDTREAVDDKEVRLSKLWEAMATHFFNNPNWNLEYFDTDRTGDAGIDFINPSEPPQGQGWAYDRLCGVFNKVKSLYTRCHDMWKSSGQQAGGGNPEIEDFLESDCDFYENFARPNFPEEARLLYYCHLLFGRAPPSFVLRTTKDNQQRQVGVSGTDIGNPTEHTLLEHNLHKNKTFAILNAFAGTLKESFGSNELTKEEKMLRKRALDAQVNRDEAIHKHFKLMNDKLEQESKNSAARISGGHLQSIEEVLRMAHLSEQDIATAAATLRSNGVKTPFALSKITQPNLVDCGIPFGDACAIHAVCQLLDIPVFQV